jgi:hypothetical protein
MANWHPMNRPHTGAPTPAHYWGGVSQLVAHSNFEQPRVSVRPGPAAQNRAIPPSWQPPTVSGGIGLDTPGPDAATWRPDEHGGSPDASL